MSTASAVQAQRIARLLGTSPSEVDYLERLDAASLRELHDQVLGVVFDPDDVQLGSLRSAARMLPPPVTAKIAERALGPVLCGHVAGALDDAAAASIARRLPPAFLADVAGHVHPQRVEVVVGRLHRRQIEGAADVLVERGDLLALGHFAGIIPVASLQSIAGRLDGATILDVAPYVEPVERVDDLVAMIEDPVLLAVIRAAHAQRRWGDAFDLVDVLGEPTRTRVASLVVPEPDILDGAIRAAAELDRWGALLSFASLAGDLPTGHWGSIEALHDDDVIAAAVDSAERLGLWDDFERLASMWPDEARRIVGGRVSEPARRRLGL